MNDRIRDAFHAVRAEEALKARTKSDLAGRMLQSRPKVLKFPRRMAVAMAACLLIALAGWSGYSLYFTPMVSISIDINPSLELGINRFDRVISVQGMNADGQKLAQSLNVYFKQYSDAVEEILSDTFVSALLDGDEVMTIAVVGSDADHCARVLDGLENCTAGQKNAYCYSADAQALAEAHELGLSYGKYRAYLELQALDSSVTPQAVQDMSMREIRDQIDSLSKSVPQAHNYGENGQGKGQRRGATHANGAQQES